MAIITILIGAIVIVIAFAIFAFIKNSNIKNSNIKNSKSNDKTIVNNILKIMLDRDTFLNSKEYFNEYTPMSYNDRLLELEKKDKIENKDIENLVFSTLPLDKQVENIKAVNDALDNYLNQLNSTDETDETDMTDEQKKEKRFMLKMIMIFILILSNDIFPDSLRNIVILHVMKISSTVDSEIYTKYIDTDLYFLVVNKDEKNNKDSFYHAYPSSDFDDDCNCNQYNIVNGSFLAAPETPSTQSNSTSDITFSNYQDFYTIINQYLNLAVTNRWIPVHYYNHFMFNIQKCLYESLEHTNERYRLFQNIISIKDELTVFTTITEYYKK